MAKIFKFKLAALKKYREQRLLSAKKDMALVLSRVTELENKLKISNFETSESIERSRDFSHGNFGLLILETKLLEGELSKKSKIKEDMLRAESELEKHRDWVAHLAKELKAVEKLEEKYKERHQAALNLKEKKETDAWVAERWPQEKLRREAQ